MIVVTGCSGFIGGALCRRLKSMNVEVKGFDYHGGPDICSPGEFAEWWEENCSRVDGVIHLGANTDTLEQSADRLEVENVGFSQVVWWCCQIDNKPLIYASSASVYGSGEFGFREDADMNKLKPLNLYAHSKLKFDKWVETQRVTPAHWYGLRFFNVYGFNESHKGRMASMVYNGYRQVKETQQISLFKSGEHARDFIYVEDIIDFIIWIGDVLPKSGIYNVGTGEARTFNDLAYSIFQAMNVEPHINYIDMPVDLRRQYQGYTQADIEKMRDIGFAKQFTTLEEGVQLTINQYIANENNHQSILTES